MGAKELGERRIPRPKGAITKMLELPLFARICQTRVKYVVAPITSVIHSVRFRGLGFEV